MKLFKILLIASIALLIVSSAAIARDFGWTRDFNIQAKADPPGFRARLATRFDLSDFQVIALRNIFASPADAYIMLRFGEMQGDLKKVSKEQGIEAVIIAPRLLTVTMIVVMLTTLTIPLVKLKNGKADSKIDSPYSHGVLFAPYTYCAAQQPLDQAHWRL